MDFTELETLMGTGRRARGEPTMAQLAQLHQREERDFAHLPEVVQGKINREGFHWIWTGRTTRKGSPVVDIGRSPRAVRRLAYSLLVIPVTTDRRVVNTCGLPLCVHPRHATVLTLEQTGRLGSRGPGTHCRRGHELTEENSLVSGGKRYCRMCRKLRRVARKAER